VRARRWRQRGGGSGSVAVAEESDEGDTNVPFQCDTSCMPTPDPTDEPTALVVEKISMHPYAHTRTCRWFFTSTLKKIKQIIGQKHRTPSEKEKKGMSKVFQRLYFFHLYAQRNHSFST